MSRLAPAFAAALLAAVVTGGLASAAPLAPPPEPPVGAPAFGSFADTELGFALERPTGQGWAVSTGVATPDGLTIPLLVTHKSAGVQIVVQVAETDANPQEMARVLAEHIREEPGIATGTSMKIGNTAGQKAFGFGFRLGGQAAGRVAVVATGERMVLVIASWPAGAAPDVVGQVDRLVESVHATAPHKGTPASEVLPSDRL